MQRLTTITELSDADIAVFVMIARVICGLTARQLQQILRAAAEAGAKSASYVVLRLPDHLKALSA